MTLRHLKNVGYGILPKLNFSCSLRKYKFFEQICDKIRITLGCLLFRFQCTINVSRTYIQAPDLGLALMLKIRTWRHGPIVLANYAIS